MILVLALGCFQLSEPFHLDSGFLQEPSDSAVIDESLNTHYVSIGGVNAGHLSFNTTASGWLAQHSAMGHSWTMSMRLPTGIPDPQESSTNPFTGWSFLETEDFSLGINLQGCKLFGSTGAEYALEGCTESSGDFALGERLTVLFEPQSSNELLVAVWVNEALLGSPLIEHSAGEVQEPRIQIGGFNADFEVLSIAAPSFAIDQLVFVPLKLDGETITDLSESNDNREIASIAEENLGQFFSLGENRDTCPTVREYANPDGIEGQLVNADCATAFAEH